MHKFRASRDHWVSSLRIPNFFTALLIPFVTFCVGLYFGSSNSWTLTFWTIFVFRYARLAGHVIAYCKYQAYEHCRSDRSYTRTDVSVIIPTIDPTGPDFEECVKSILANQPKALYIVTVGTQLLEDCKKVLQTLDPSNSETLIEVSAVPVASKRRQVAHAVPRVDTPITVLADDHVFWESDCFLNSLVEPLNEQGVGVVAPRKTVRRTTPGVWSWDSVVNFIACNYLERHNWELRASSSMDGGLFVVSGRTAAYLTEILNPTKTLRRFCNEKFLCGFLGGGLGLGPDDDNFLTREALKQGYKLRFQDSESSGIGTTLGEWPKFQDQLLRWARTTFRSNPVMLRDVDFLYWYPWAYFMVYLAGMTNFALVWDSALVISLYKSDRFDFLGMLGLLTWIVFTKSIKILPHFVRHPSDILLFPAQVAFAYVHSIIKFWALFTFWNCDWSGRRLEDVNSHSDEVPGDFVSIYEPYGA